MITRLRITKQNADVLSTEIVTGVFPPVAEDNTRCSIGSSPALKTFVATVYHGHNRVNIPTQVPMCFL